MHGEGEFGHPWPPRQLVLQIELRRGGIIDERLRPHLVIRRDQKIGFAAAHQVDIAEWPRHIAGMRRGPDEAGRPRRHQVDDSEAGIVIRGWKVAEQIGGAQPVAGLIEIQADTARTGIDDIGGTRPVDIREGQPLGVEDVRGIENGRIRQGHLGAEPPIAEIGPVADFVKANPDKIGQSIADHVGQEDRLAGIREDATRPLFLIPLLEGPVRRPESVLAE